MCVAVLDEPLFWETVPTCLVGRVYARAAVCSDGVRRSCQLECDSAQQACLDLCPRGLACRRDCEVSTTAASLSPIPT